MENSRGDQERARVVVTGYGIINSLGQDAFRVKEQIFRGESGLAHVAFQEEKHGLSGTAGRCRPVLTEEDFFRREGIPPDVCVALALISAEEALKMADLIQTESDPLRFGIAVGTSLGGMCTAQRFHRMWRKHSLQSADPADLIQYPLHAVADALAIRFGLQGIRGVISTACSAGAGSIGFAADMIRDGLCDRMLAGGVDPLCSFSFAGFHALGALDEQACSPYGASRGINLGEGGAFLVLEKACTAEARGARILAEICGYGMSADAYHPTAPDPAGGGAARSMITALEMSGCRAEQVVYVNGHGTGTHANDHAEQKAMRRVFGDRASQVPISSVKGAVGHCLGGAGAQEAVISIMALEERILPPTLRADEKKRTDFDFVPKRSRPFRPGLILSNSFAFGGNNCTLAIGPAGLPVESRAVDGQPGVTMSADGQPGRAVSADGPTGQVTDLEGRPERTGDKEKLSGDFQDRLNETVITGIGCCGTGGSGITALWRTFDRGESCIESMNLESGNQVLKGASCDVDWKDYIPGKVLRRIDRVTKLTLTAGREALLSSGLTINEQTEKRTGVIYGTGTGPLETIVGLDREMIEKGMDQITLSHFPNSVMNAAPGYLCMMHRLKGPSSTVSSGYASFALALLYGRSLLRSGMADALVIVSADECSEDLLQGEERLGLLAHAGRDPENGGESRGLVLSEGAVAVVLETRRHAEKRGARIYAKVTGAGAAGETAGMLKVSGDGKTLAECMERVLAENEMSGPGSGIDLCSVLGTGIRCLDLTERHALEQLQKKGLLRKDVPVSAVAGMIGTPSGSASGYQLLSLLYAFERKRVILPDGTVRRMEGSPVRACMAGEALGGLCSCILLEKEQVDESQDNFSRPGLV